jgi:hypothetical protein
MRLSRLSNMLAGLAVAIAGPLGVAVPPAQAADHVNLEEEIPVQVEDAYPIPYRGREFQGLLRYERTADDKDRFRFEPRLEVGIAPNWQVRLSAPFLVGSAEKTGSGDVGLEAFYNFNTESLRLPAFALSSRFDFPTGPDTEGVDTTVKFIATKSLGESSLLQRLHLNLSWTHNAGRLPTERRDRFAGVLGYSQRVGPDTILVADFVREQEREKDKTANILEGGIRHQLDPLTVLAIGVGAGVGPDSPDVRITLGFQRSLTFLPF